MRALGINTVAEATAILTSLGRSGLPPWCADEYKQDLSYISPSSLMLVPTWHLLCRGITREVLNYALTTLLKADDGGVGQKHPFVFNAKARQRVRVRISCMC